MIWHIFRLLFPTGGAGRRQDFCKEPLPQDGNPESGSANHLYKQEHRGHDHLNKSHKAVPDGDCGQSYQWSAL